ncbi:MAG: adenosylcobinamide amidohydrolase [Rhodobacter sp.]|nr:adenosylcobinamide amidohydrolase [Rhodobacter sp.]
MIAVTLRRPWLEARLTAHLRVLSHAPFGAGYRTTDLVLWREVRNADLAPDFPVEDWFAREMAARPGAVGMLTSRDVGTWAQARAAVDGVRAHCVLTLGLSNAESVGVRLPWHPADYGTINLLVATDAGLTEAAQLEALTVSVQARTAGVMAAGLQLASGLATGTGTDCVALACVPGAGRYAGLHTAVGEAVGAAVRQAVTAAAADWLRWRDAERAKR